jgi:hypothetical protein
MSRELVFIHGRSQQHKDAQALKDAWIEAWEEGLAKSELSLPIDVSAIHFPYYGDTLDGLLHGEDDVADVIVRGAKDDSAQRALLLAVLEEARAEAGVTDAQLDAAAQAHARAVGEDVTAIQRGPLNWHWVRVLVSALDTHLPGASGTTLALATDDVWNYMNDARTRNKIDTGVRAALPRDADSVVVAHSLGTVIAYNLLTRDGAIAGWHLPLFVTLGSPLAVRAIRQLVEPTEHPACVEGPWFNAMDPRDIVALHPLDRPWFAVTPPIDNKTDVDNGTPNRHGIAGYLSDQVVAKRIYDAVT